MTDPVLNAPSQTVNRRIGGDLAGFEWLVSVRDLGELEMTASFAVDILDFKEPSAGPLAPVSSSIWHQAAKIVHQMKPTVRLSAALGERGEMLQTVGEVPSTFSFAKVGPSGCRCTQDLESLWSHARERLPSSVELVAVAYADHESAGCVSPQIVFQTARAFGIRKCLVDTYEKNGQSTWDILGSECLVELGNTATDGALWWAMAGSIKLQSVHDLTRQGIRPNCFGVRGDVCGDGRTGDLCTRRLAAWSRCLAGLDRKTGSPEA